MLVRLGYVTRETMDLDYYRELLRKYREGACSDEEKRLLDSWYESLQFDTHLPVEDGDEAGALTEKNWEDLLERKPELREYSFLPASRNDPSGYLRRFRPFLAAAGISALLVAFGLLFYERGTLKETVAEKVISGEEEFRVETAPEAGSKLIVLSDGSRVTLLDGGVLKYRYGFDTDRREVFLQGQAYFEVAENKEKPFYVYANDVITKVLGTSFLVKASDRNMEVEVSVTKGKVSVYKAGGQPFKVFRDESVVLLPQQQVSYSAAAGKMVRSDIADPGELIPSERPAGLIFENAPLPAILEAVQSIYHVRFEFDRERFAFCTLTTSIEDETLDEMLLIISGLLDMEYTVSGNVISLEGKGC